MCVHLLFDIETETDVPKYRTYVKYIYVYKNIKKLKKLFFFTLQIVFKFLN